MVGILQAEVKKKGRERRQFGIQKGLLKYLLTLHGLRGY